MFKHIRITSQSKDWVLETLDKETVALAVGCVFAWMNLLRYFKFHNKFHVSIILLN